MLIDRLKSDILFAVKAKSELAIGLLKLVLGECQAKDNYSDDFIVKFCRKVIENNLETMRLAGEKVKLLRENELLRAYVPAELSEAELQVYIDQISPEIMAAKSEGQAIGILSKHLKGLSLITSGETAKSAVKRIRGGICV
jgi:uncharacterized protein YqeY